MQSGSDRADSALTVRTGDVQPGGDLLGPAGWGRIEHDDMKAGEEGPDFGGDFAGYTWHHLEDGKTMVLVEKKVHAEFTHEGGVSVANK